MSNHDFNFFEDFSIQEQNVFLKTYLIHTTRFLEPLPFPNSPEIYYYQHVFYDNEYHGNSISNLAFLLCLLETRDVLWPIRVKTTNSGIPFFAFTVDLKHLDEADDDFFEIIQEDEIIKIARVIEN